MTYIILGVVSVGSPLHADRSIFQDDALAGRQQWRADFGLTYTTISSHSVVLQGQEPDGGSQNLQTRSDIFNTTIGVRFGATSDIELSVGAEFENGREALIADGRSLMRTQWQGPSMISLGVNYQVVRDQRFPGVVLSLEAKVLDWTSWEGEAYRSNEPSVFKGFGIGGLVYHRVDPIILFMSAGHSIELTRTLSDHNFVPPAVFQIQPGFNFAVNQEITLSFTTLWLQTHDWISHEYRRGATQTNVRLTLGFVHRITNKLSTGFTVGLNTTGTTYPIVGLNSQVEL